MHPAKRVEIIIEAPMESRLTAALITAGVTGFTVLLGTPTTLEDTSSGFHCLYEPSSSVRTGPKS